MPGKNSKNQSSEVLRKTGANPPRVSIICPIFKVEKYIAEMIESVLAQSYSDWELIIMDGASPDDTLDIVYSYSIKDARIKVYSEPDEGPWHAVDKGFDRARGEFLTILCGQDGLLDKDWFLKCIEVFDKEKNVSLVWALNLGMTEDGEIVPETHFSYSQFIQPEGSGNAIFYIFRKFFYIFKDLLFSSKDRKKILLGKLFSSSAAFKLSLLTKRSFKETGYPQKEAWLDYWLKTGLVFPDQSMVISKPIFLRCVPRYRKGDPVLSYMTDFYFNFNSRGYLPYYLPTHASFGRNHPGSSGDRKPKEIYLQNEKYYKRISDLKHHLNEGHLLFSFHDRNGNVISRKQF